LRSPKELYLKVYRGKDMPAERMAPKEKAKLNIGISPEVATALRKYALEKTGTMRGISSVVEDALVEYLRKHDVTISFT
jgi:hypothetical protein